MLDADLILAREGEERTRLGLVGSYRPPLGRTGAALDRAVMSRIAAATIRSLLEEIAAAVALRCPTGHRRAAPGTTR